MAIIMYDIIMLLVQWFLVLLSEKSIVCIVKSADNGFYLVLISKGFNVTYIPVIPQRIFTNVSFDFIWVFKAETVPFMYLSCFDHLSQSISILPLLTQILISHHTVLISGTPPTRLDRLHLHDKVFQATGTQGFQKIKDPSCRITDCIVYLQPVKPGGKVNLPRCKKCLMFATIYQLSMPAGLFILRQLEPWQEDECG